MQPLFDLHGLGGSLPGSCLPPAPSPELAPEALPCSSGLESLAPEVWRKDFGPKCDVWSCGCLLFLLLTGRLPFAQGKSVSDLARKPTRKLILKMELKVEQRIPWFPRLSYFHHWQIELPRPPFQSML